MPVPGTEPGERILVAMSGGVDSSLAAWLLERDGHPLVGVNMRTHRLSPEELALGARIKTCCSPTDARDARACADRTGFPFYVLDLEHDFARDVIDPFVQAYRDGRTPNPCVLCNNKVKLGLLLEKARLWGCTKVATGHYARKVRHPDTGRWTLARARDTAKDQAYYLFGLRQEQLDLLVLPVGEMTKAEVRALAREAALPTADKPESQEICFVPSNDYRAFLRREFARRGIAMPRGKVLSTAGEVMAEHEGIAYFTVGQRKGLGFARPEPYYVVQLDPAHDNVIVGTRDESFSGEALVDGINWMGIAGIEGPTPARVQVRYHLPMTEAVLHPVDGEPGAVRVEFAEPQLAVTPGQAAVFYDGEDRVLGGGWIRVAARTPRHAREEIAPHAP